MPTEPYILNADATFVECDILNGPRPGMTLRMNVWEVPGFDGYGAQTLGMGGGRFELLCTKFEEEAEVETWITSMEALAGTVVSIVAPQHDGVGTNTDANMMIQSAELREKKKVATVVGPPGASGFDTVAVVSLRGVRDKVPV